MRFSRIYLVLLALVPISIGAVTIDPQSTLSQVNLLISQYEARIKQLEAENSVLRYEMAKAGIKIPLVEYSGAIATPLPGEAPKTSTASILPSSSSSWEASIPDTTLSEITTKYGKDVAGFISRANKDWVAIKSAYWLPSGARLAGYEFVQSGGFDHVFADIIVGTGTTWIYDIKILYQFEKTEYKRKLIGIFDYDSTLARYKTRTWSNPFGWVSRIFIRDPYFAGIVTPPATVSSSSSGSTSTPADPTISPVAPIATGSVTLAQINQAYNEKRYLTTISLSNSYLTTNKATIELLSIRYRTYFIIGKYSESLTEIAKMETLSSLDRQTACNAQVIATYSKNQALVDKYTKICKQ